MISPQKRYQFVAIGIALGVFFLYLFTLSNGTMWGDDWAMYVNHAVNIAKGRPYAYPGYIFNPMYPTYAPSAYPAGYPLMLAPAAAIWGINLTAFKIINLLCLSAGLYLSWYWLRNRVSPAAALLIPLVIGISPYFWFMRDHILSDVPHMTFTVLFFVLLDRWQERADWKTAIWLGLTLFYVYALRSIGLVLMGAFALHVLFGPARLRKTGALAVGLAVALWALHNAIVPSDSYYQMIAGQKFRVIDRLYDGLRPYAQEFGALVRIWENNDLLAFGKIFAALLPVFIVSGLVGVRRWTILETFCATYLLAITFFPGFQGFRYLVGVFPFFLYYAALFVENLPVKQVKYALSVILLVTFFGVTIQWYVQNRNAPMLGNIYEENAQKFFAFVRDSVPHDAVLVADRPRILALYTEHKGTVYPDVNHEQEWLGWLDQNQVTYATKAAWDNDKPDRYWARFMDANPLRFEKIFDSGGLQVYKYHQTPVE